MSGGLTQASTYQGAAGLSARLPDRKEGASDCAAQPDTASGVATSCAVETWAPIPGFDGYEASDIGNVRSLKYGEPRPLRAHPNNRNGRLQVTLRANGRTVARYTYQLVLLAFRGPPAPGQQVRHVLSNDLRDNRLANLAYGTPVENAADCLLHGTRLRGVGHPRTRITDETLSRIVADPRPQAEVAADYGVSQAQVSWYKRGFRSDPKQAERKRLARRAARST